MHATASVAGRNQGLCSSSAPGLALFGVPQLPRALLPCPLPLVRAARELIVCCNSSSSSSSSEGDINTQGGDAPANTKKKAGYVYEHYRRKHTLGAVYLDQGKGQEIPTVDHHTRRRQRDIKEIAEAARKLNLTEAQVEENLNQLRLLLPGLTPNLFKMKAGEWAQVLAQVQGTATALIMFKSLYPGVDLIKVIARTPRLLLKDPTQMREDAAKVRQILKSLEQEEFDAVIEAVPYLVDPQQLVQGLNNFKAWFPQQDPIDMLKADPTKLINVEEADLEADPIYGELTSAG